jgi:hypothetical protein
MTGYYRIIIFEWKYKRRTGTNFPSGIGCWKGVEACGGGLILRGRRQDPSSVARKRDREFGAEWLGSCFIQTSRRVKSALKRHCVISKREKRDGDNRIEILNSF